MRILLMAILTLWTGAAGAAPCEGRNLIDALSAADRSRLDAAVDKIPYHSGLLWRATKDSAKITLVGTYHFPDERHQQMLERLEDEFGNAAAIYVEAGPREEERLTKALNEDPSLMVNESGPTLPERLNKQEWEILSRAMSERGLPAVVTAKLRPWYVAMMMGISPCILRDAGQAGKLSGLDHLLIEEARDLDLPIRALEPWDTVFSLFTGMTPKEEMDMIRTALPVASNSDDYAVTLTDAGPVTVPSAGVAVMPSGTSSCQPTVSSRASDRSRVTVAEAPGRSDSESGEKEASTPGSGAVFSIVV